MQVDWSGIIFALVIGAIVLFTWMYIDEKKEQQQNTQRKIPNENTVGLAVIFIETAAKFVKENQSFLNCNQITMWQHSELGKGFTVEFYGFDLYSRPTIEKMLVDTFGSWKVWEDSKDEVLHITHTGMYSYTGSWNSFNKTVWEEVKRKHPEWKIEKPFSHKYVLYV